MASYTFSATPSDAPEQLFELGLRVVPSTSSTSTSTTVNISVVRLVDHLLGEVITRAFWSLRFCVLYARWFTTNHVVRLLHLHDLNEHKGYLCMLLWMSVNTQHNTHTHTHTHTHAHTHTHLHTCSHAHNNSQQHNTTPGCTKAPRVR